MLSFAALSFLRSFQKRYTTAAMTIAPTPTPAPIPALALVESPESSDDPGVPSAESVGADVSLVVVLGSDVVVVVDDAPVVVAGAVVDVDSPLNIVPTTAY